MRTRIALAVSGLVAVVALGSCSSDSTGPALGPALIIVQPSAATIQGGQELGLSVVATGGAAAELRDGDVIWSSADPGVANVSRTGVVRGGKAGSTEIVAQWREVQGRATMVVLEETRQGPKCSKGPCPLQ